MAKNRYDDMPLREIQDLSVLCFQIAKRNAEKCLKQLMKDCDEYCIDLNCCLKDFKLEVAKQYKKYEGD